MICNKTRCCHPAKAFQLSVPNPARSRRTPQTIDFTSYRAFRLNKGDVFPWWATPARWDSTLRLSDWSSAVAPTLRPCQEPPELSWDEWGRASDPDFDVRSAIARNKRCSTTKPRVKRPCCCSKGAQLLLARGHGGMLTPMRTQLPAVWLSLHWQTRS